MAFAICRASGDLEVSCSRIKGSPVQVDNCSALRLRGFRLHLPCPGERDTTLESRVWNPDRCHKPATDIRIHPPDPTMACRCTTECSIEAHYWLEHHVTACSEAGLAGKDSVRGSTTPLNIYARELEQEKKRAAGDWITTSTLAPLVSNPPLPLPCTFVLQSRTVVSTSLHVRAAARARLATLIGPTSRPGLDARRRPSPPLHDRLPPNAWARHWALLPFVPSPFASRSDSSTHLPPFNPPKQHPLNGISSLTDLDSRSSRKSGVCFPPHTIPWPSQPIPHPLILGSILLPLFSFPPLST